MQKVAADLRGVAEWKESKKGDVKADLWLVDGAPSVQNACMRAWPACAHACTLNTYK